MKRIKKDKFLIMKKIILSFLFSSATFAQTLYNFSNLNLNYFQWNDQTKEKTGDKDFFYLGYEGGVGWDWSEFYGYINIENPTNSYDDGKKSLRFSAYGDYDINIKNGFKIHFQDFHLHSHDYYVNDFVIGFAYKYSIKNFWIKPFLGLHVTNDSFYNGLNGCMTGWVLNYTFKLFEQSFVLENWNEIEFLRDNEFYEIDNEPIGDGKSYGLNGEVKLWWFFYKDMSAGVRYRYADYKLGNAFYQSGFIYTLRYHF